jgi:hypothetical protein
MVYSQIWLNHLPNDWQFGYKTILKERKPIPPTSMILCKIINRFKIPKRRVMEDEGIFNFDVSFVAFNFHVKVNCWHLCMD